MSYQAVIRNSSNALLTSTLVGMQISVLQGSSTGTSVYVETQTPSTNSNGLVSLEIGMGKVVKGTFAGIDWANGPYFIKTETDITGGIAYSIAGTNELMSVPYALFSANATAQFRIPNRTTAFGQNLPIGTQIFVLSDSTLWQTINPIASIKTIDNSYTDLVLINRSAKYYVESFEAASSSSTYALTYHPVLGTGGITVMMNGAAMRPGTDYTCLGKILTIISSQLQYDKFVVSYTHTTN